MRKEEYMAKIMEYLEGVFDRVSKDEVVMDTIDEMRINVNTGISQGDAVGAYIGEAVKDFRGTCHISLADTLVLKFVPIQCESSASLDRKQGTDIQVYAYKYDNGVIRRVYIEDSNPVSLTYSDSSIQAVMSKLDLPDELERQQEVVWTVLPEVGTSLVNQVQVGLQNSVTILHGKFNNSTVGEQSNPDVKVMLYYAEDVDNIDPRSDIRIALAIRGDLLIDDLAMYLDDDYFVDSVSLDSASYEDLEIADLQCILTEYISVFSSLYLRSHYQV